MSTTIPVRSAEQHMAALAHGNDIRSRRSEFKRQMKAAGREKALLMAAMVVADVPWWLETMKAYDLLKAIPRWGTARTAKTLTSLQISHSRTLVGLTTRQRLALDEALTEAQ